MGGEFVLTDCDMDMVVAQCHDERNLYSQFFRHVQIYFSSIVYGIPCSKFQEQFQDPIDRFQSLQKRFKARTNGMLG